MLSDTEVSLVLVPSLVLVTQQKLHLSHWKQLVSSESVAIVMIPELESSQVLDLRSFLELMKNPLLRVTMMEKVPSLHLAVALKLLDLIPVKKHSYMNLVVMLLPQEQEDLLVLELQLFLTIQLFQSLHSVSLVKVHFQPSEEQQNLEQLMLRILLSLNSAMVLQNPSLKGITIPKDRQQSQVKHLILNLPVVTVDSHMLVLLVILMILVLEHMKDLVYSPHSVVRLNPELLKNH